MSGHNLISAEQAKELLKDTTPGRWSTYVGGFGVIDNIGPIEPGIGDGLEVSEADAYLAAAAPDLAHTVIAQAGRIAMLEARYVKHHEQIERLQGGLREIDRWDLIPTPVTDDLIEDLIITPQDMETPK